MAPRNGSKTAGERTRKEHQDSESTQRTNGTHQAKSRKQSDRTTGSAGSDKSLHPVEEDSTSGDRMQVDGEPESGGDLDEVAILKAKLAKAEQARAAAEASLAVGHNNEQTVKTLVKPPGSAGDRQRGYKLRYEMELRGKKGKKLYNEILESVRMYAIQAGLDLKTTYRNQDHQKLGNVFAMVRSVHPYMTQDRFPADWAAAAMLKQFLSNHRSWLRRNGRLETAGSQKGKRRAENGNDSRSSSNSSDDGDGNGGLPTED
ncbi:hypothetical protein HWV62_34505 [Athelia sp. TMB]|nr:hypothetical protein HWV62_34505 [Athelia sp. TMB]